MLHTLNLFYMTMFVTWFQRKIYAWLPFISFLLGFFSNLGGGGWPRDFIFTKKLFIVLLYYFISYRHPNVADNFKLYLDIVCSKKLVLTLSPAFFAFLASGLSCYAFLIFFLFGFPGCTAHTQGVSGPCFMVYQYSTSKKPNV